MFPTGVLDLTLGELVRGHPAMWIVGLGLVVAWVASAVRVVTEQDRVVVRRLGRTIRVSGPGLVLRLPILERCTTVSLRVVQVPLNLSATTRDGVPLHVLARGQLQITDPALSLLADPDPLTAAVDALESQVARAVGREELGSLLCVREQLELKLPADVSALTEAWGVQVSELEIIDIEAQVSPQLLRSTDQVPGGNG